MNCPICHTALSPKSPICRGRTPGAFGLVRLSSGPCQSTPEDRERFEAERRARVASQPVEC